MTEKTADQWTVLEKQTVLQHPFLRVEMEKLLLPDGRIIPDWPIVHMREYVNAFVMNEANEVLIFEGYKHGPDRTGWQVLGGYVEKGEAPLAAVQRELLEETGLQSSEWEHLGNYVTDANRRGGLGHFFIARRVQSVGQGQDDENETSTAKWVSLEEIQAALFDGRFISLTYAVSTALGLIRLLQHETQRKEGR